MNNLNIYIQEKLKLNKNTKFKISDKLFDNLKSIYINLTNKDVYNVYKNNEDEIKEFINNWLVDNKLDGDHNFKFNADNEVNKYISDKTKEYIDKFINNDEVNKIMSAYSLYANYNPLYRNWHEDNIYFNITATAKGSFKAIKIVTPYISLYILE